MRSFYFAMILLASIFIISCSGSESTDKKCSSDNPTGTCDDGFVCNEGACEEIVLCSSSAPNGHCADGHTCQDGICVSDEICSEDNPNGTCDDSSKYCDAGNCVDKLSQYKLGTISQTIDTISKPNILLNEYHYEVMDITGRNKLRVTNDVQSCINEEACWASKNYKYFLYLKEAGEDYPLYIVDIPEDFKTNFTTSVQVTSKLVGEPYFLNDGVSFLYIEDVSANPQTSVLMLKKYNMQTRTSSLVAKYSVEKMGQDADGNPVPYDAPAGNFVVSDDNSMLIFDLEAGYNDPVEIYSLDLNNPANPPVMFYKYARVNKSGNGIKWAKLSSDNKTLAFVSSFDLKHRLHFAYLDKSSLVEDGGDPENAPLGKYIGPLENACGDIQGIQMCEMKSDLVYSKDNKFLYFAGRVDGGTDLSPLVNIYKFDIENDTLLKLTDENTEFQDAPFQSVIFSTETGNALYTMAQQGAIKNHDAHYLNLSSTESDMGSKIVFNTREARELKLFLLKR